MRPDNLHTKIFLDGGDPVETKEILDLLGFLDGQTTNPTLVSRNPKVKEKCIDGDGCSEDEIYAAYKDIVTEISKLIPQGSVSVEVYADEQTELDAMFAQSKDMYSWIPNAHIKFPTTATGLQAAEKAVAEHMRVNMTLCFTQSQAAAVHAATRGATERGQVFVSPFIGRLDDKGENGMDLIKNIIKMYKKASSHVEVLTASVRSLQHFMAALALGSDIITAPGSILRAWAEGGMQIPDSSYSYAPDSLQSIPYMEFDLSQDWKQFDISHPLTAAGIQKFSEDWNSLVK